MVQICSATDQYQGIHSKARKIVDKTAEDARPTEFVAYRAMAPTKLMRDDPDTAWLLEEPDLNLWYAFDPPPFSTWSHQLSGLATTSTSCRTRYLEGIHSIWLWRTKTAPIHRRGLQPLRVKTWNVNLQDGTQGTYDSR
jgi:hypothetical protein